MSFMLYAEMAKEATLAPSSQPPAYKVELAMSSRSKCSAAKNASAKKCATIGSEGSFIEKGAIRFGSLDQKSDGYTRLRHLACWRVPTAVWIGLPRWDSSKFIAVEVEKVLCGGMNEVVFTGFSDLPKEDKALVISYIMDTNNWSRETYRKPTDFKSELVGSRSKISKIPNEDRTSPHIKILAFEAPLPGKNGASALFLVGKTVVMTGLMRYY